MPDAPGSASRSAGGTAASRHRSRRSPSARHTGAARHDPSRARSGRWQGCADRSGRSADGPRTGRRSGAPPRATRWGARTRPRSWIGCCRCRVGRRARSSSACGRPSCPGRSCQALLGSRRSSGGRIFGAERLPARLRRPPRRYSRCERGEAKEEKGRTMTTFRDLGVSDEVVACPRRARDRVAVPDPGHGDRGRDVRPGHARAVEDGLRQDPRVRDPDRRPGRSGCRAPPRRPGPHAHPRARPTGQRRVRGHREGEEAPRDGRLRRHAGAGAVQGRRVRPHPDRDPRAPRRPHRARHGSPGRRQDLRPRRGGPDAGHGLPATGRPDRAPSTEGPSDDVLLGDARRRDRQDRGGLHAQPDAPRGRSDRDAVRGGGRPSVHPRGAGRTSSRRSSGSPRRRRARRSCS